MKKIIIVLALTGILASNKKVVAQDLTSINVGTALPSFTFNTNTNALTVQMTVRNVGFFNSNAFDVALFLKNTNTNAEYEIDRVNQSGLSYNQLNNANTLQITNWTVDLDNESQVPGGTYRVIARINDNQNATETNYNNNTENFGNTSFIYDRTTVGISEVNKDIDFVIYPNPAKDDVIIKWQDDQNLSLNRYIEVYNADAKKVYESSSQMLQGSDEIDFSGWPVGVYFVRVYNDKRSVTKKIIIQ